MTSSAKSAPTPEPELEPPWWGPRRGARRRQQPLSRQAIVEAAVRILDAEGVGALTVRRLGDELGTGSATLYWHIRSKDDLGDLVYDHVMGEIELPDPDPSIWEAQLKEFARRSYRVMLRHNDLVRLSVGRVPVGPNMLRIIEWALGLVRAAGVPDQAAAYFGDIFGRYLDASVLEATTRGGPPLDQISGYFASLPEDRFPNVLAVSTAMFAGDDNDRFDFGLDLLVRGLAALVPKAKKGR